MLVERVESAAERNNRQLLPSNPNVSRLNVMKINENYYAIKKIRSKIKAHARHATDRKLAERRQRRVWKGKPSLQPPSVLSDHRQPTCCRLLASSSSVHEEVQTLIFESYVVVHNGSEL